VAPQFHEVGFHFSFGQFSLVRETHIDPHYHVCCSHSVVVCLISLSSHLLRAISFQFFMTTITIE
jgi:hypothetical protein